MDDVDVFSATVTEHIQRLDAVLGRLQREGLKVKLEKCSFFRPEVSYLGRVISREGVATDPGKIEAVAKYPRPSHVSELRSFLGFASYYRRFVEGFTKPHCIAWLFKSLVPKPRNHQKFPCLLCGQGNVSRALKA